MLAHTKNSLVSYKTDPCHKAVETKEDYKEEVVTPEWAAKLFAALENIDPVYNHIAFMMMTTGLRIGGIIQFPLGANKQNPNWLRYPELKQTAKSQQGLRYIPKGKRQIKQCMVPTAALEELHQNYIKKIRPERAKLYESKKGTIASHILWLNKNGKEIYRNDIWNAFSKASALIERKITPQFMRHTYATYIIYNYFKAHGLKPNLAYAHDIHEQLRKQLGHSSKKTTQMYIKTIMNVEAEAWLPLLTPGIAKEIGKRTSDQVQRAVKAFFEPEKVRESP